MQISASALAQLLGGTVEGNPDITVSRPAKIEEASAGTISFLANPKYEHYAYTTQASILLVSNTFVAQQPITATLVRVADVYACVALLLNQFGQQVAATGNISPKAEVHPDAIIGNNVSIGAFTVVEAGAQIGDNSVLFPQVYIGKDAKVGSHTTLNAGVRVYHECVIGNHCIIHGNAVIGSDGFGFAPQADGTYQKVAQIGIVEIGDHVEIGANTVIDRATMGATRIHKGVKLDNLIQIAHNVEIGENTVIAAQTGVAGSTKIGKGAMIGGQVGFVGHIHIADGVRIQAQSGINATIKEVGSAWYGSPMLPYKDYLRSYAVFKNLPALSKRLHDIEKQTKE